MSLILLLVPAPEGARLLSSALEAAGQTVHVVGCNHARDVTLQVNRLKPDVLAVHAGIPNAAEACRRVLGHPVTRYVPIVALTDAGPSEETILTFLNAGAHDVLDLSASTALQVARIDNMARVNHLRRTYRRLNDKVAIHRAEFEAVFDGAPVGLVLAGGNGAVTRLNQSAQALLGGHSIYDLRPVEGGRIARAHPLMVAATKGERSTPKRFAVQDDSGERVLVVEGFPLTVAGDLPVGGVAVVMSDGEGSDLSRALRDAARGLARQTEDLERFVSTASHDMKNPLSTIQRYVELALDEPEDSVDDVAGWLKRIDVNAGRLRVLVEGLSRVVRSRRDTLTLAPAELSHVVSDAIRIRRSEVEASDATIQVDDPLPAAWLDFDMIVRVMDILLDNAIKYRKADQPCRIRVGTAEIEPDQTYLYVQDNGIGVDPCHHAEIFEPFERLHRNDLIPGSGLGLAIAHQLIERHGGRMWITSALGQGATFHIVLPTSG